MTNRTRPSGEPGGVPSGTPTRIEPKDDAQTTRGKMRENETAVIMARAGYNVEQRPSIAGDKEPDYAIEGRIFDCYAPITAKAYNIAETIGGKGVWSKTVGTGRASRTPALPSDRISVKLCHNWRKNASHSYRI